MDLLKPIEYLFLVTLTACSHETELQRMADFINDPQNKLTQSIRIGEVNIIARWLPEYYRNAADKHLSKKEDDYYYYFEIKFTKEGIDKFPTEKMLYLNFDMQNDFTLLLGRDSIVPAICQKIENGISGSYQYIVAFEKPVDSMMTEAFTIFYKDRVFGTGTVAFVFRQNDLEKLFKI